MMITCNDCGKLHEGKEIGTYWICEDCNFLPEQEDENEGLPRK